MVLDTASNDAQLVLGHPVRSLTEGFQGIGRLKRLALSALTDLSRCFPIGSWPSRVRGSRLYLCLAHDLETRMRLEASDTAELAGSLSSALDLAPAVVISGGPSSVIQALRLASEEFDRRSIDCAIVVGVDSYLDQESVDWLIDQRRLKTLERPTGLMPGEAAGCLFIGPCASDRHEGLGCVATITEAAFQPCAATDPPHIGIAKALSVVLAQAMGETIHGETVSVIANLNGEDRLANAWGSYLAGTGVPTTLRSGRLITPLAQLGEIGAAFGAVAICIAAQALARRYAPSEDLLVAAIPFEGIAASCRVTAPPDSAIVA